MSVESWKILLHNVFNASEEDFRAYYPLFPEPQAGKWEIKQRLGLIQSLIMRGNPSEPSSSTGESMSEQKTERKIKISPFWNPDAEIPINNSNRKQLLEGRPVINTAYGIRSMPNDHFETVWRHYSLPKAVQGHMELPDHHIDTTILTRLMYRTNSEVMYTESTDTEEEDLNEKHECLIRDLDHFAGQEGDEEDFLQRYTPSIEASLQEVG